MLISWKNCTFAKEITTEVMNGTMKRDDDSNIAAKYMTAYVSVGKVPKEEKWSQSTCLQSSMSQMLTTYLTGLMTHLRNSLVSR